MDHRVLRRPLSPALAGSTRRAPPGEVRAPSPRRFFLSAGNGGAVCWAPLRLGVGVAVGVTFDAQAEDGRTSP